MENNKIDVLRVEPLKNPELISIENSVEDFQREVEGYFEITYPFEDPVAILCNEEGKIDKWYPSSQICSHCGTIHPEMKDLCIRVMECNCGLKIRRDRNAAINIRNEGLRLLKSAA